MIRERESKSLIEVKEILAGMEKSEKVKELEVFIKKFIKMDKKSGEEIKKELEGLGLLKLKREHIVKIMDLLPEDAEDLNKIFTDISLDTNETQKILETIKKYK